ncbi:MAG: transporter substrate-binding domain-containing protein [Woeseia sp.]
MEPQPEQYPQLRFGFLAPMLLLLPMLLAGCELPETFPVDPERTLQKVRGGSLRAGVIHAPPWVIAEGDPSGVEADLVRHLARDFAADIEWVRGAPDQLLVLLEEHELDILIGGFEKSSPVTKKVGKTRPYASVEWWLLGQAADADISGEPVGVEHGKAAALVKAAHATPVFRTRPGAPALQVLPRMGKKAPVPPQGIRVLGSSHHVLLLPPGENAWVVAVDRSLQKMPEKAAGGNSAEGPTR